MIIQRTCWHEDVKGIFSQVYWFWFFGSCLLNYQICKCTKKRLRILGFGLSCQWWVIKKQTFTIIKQSVRIFLCPVVHFLCGPKQKRIFPSLVLSHAFPYNFELKITSESAWDRGSIISKFGFYILECRIVRLLKYLFVLHRWGHLPYCLKIILYEKAKNDCFPDIPFQLQHACTCFICKT